MKSDKNGCSTCAPGGEQWEAFRAGKGKRRYLQYDYRTPGGELFSCVAVDLQAARQKRDGWLKARNKGRH
jgi:hypothetical protein